LNNPNLQNANAAAAELQRAVKELGFKGALINGQTNGYYLDADMYLPFWERVQDLGVPIYLHPGELVDHPAMFAGRPELNGAVWAWTVETGSHALRLVFGGTFTRFPKLKIILGHMGETLPFLLWRFDSRWQCELGEDLPPEMLPSAIIKRNFVITTSGVCDARALAEAIAALGEDNVMFSVDIHMRTRKPPQPSSNPRRSARWCVPRCAMAMPCSSWVCKRGSCPILCRFSDGGDERIPSVCRHAPAARSPQ
jgi:2,3-dihydroxybenzoate decarboxylase